MVNKKNLNTHHPSKKYLLVMLFVACFVGSALAATDYCITNKAHDVIGLVGTEALSLTLGDYVRGYNLSFSTDQPINARTSNPLNSIGSIQFSFGEGYKMINTDVLQSMQKKWHQPGVIFAQRDYKSVGLALTQFTGTRSISQKIDHRYYTLDTQANCFSANIIDTNSNVVIDCQTNDEDNPQDMVCFIDGKDAGKKFPSSCLKLDSINEVKDRKSEILMIGKEIFLLSASYSREEQTDDVTYLTIYRVDAQKQTLQFANIIDGYQLGLDDDIVISDFDVLPNGNILIHDLSKSRLLFVQYKLSNEISLSKAPWVYGSKGTQIQVTDVNTVLIATNTYVEEWDLQKKNRIFRYELEKGDYEVIGLGVNTYGIIVQTSRNSLSVYQRIMSPLNYVLGTINVHNKDYLISPYSNILYIFDEAQYDIYELNSGALTLNNFAESTNITITGKSVTSTCKFTLQILALNSTDKIVTKENVLSKRFVKQQNQVVSLNLQEIFSGQDLRYEVPQSTKNITYSLEQLETYQINSGLKKADLIQVVNYNKTAYFMLGLQNNEANLQMCTVSEDNSQVNCQNIYSSKIMENPLMIFGKQRKSGKIVFVWTYSQQRFEVLTYHDGKVTRSLTFCGQELEYSSVVISEDKIFFVLKEYAMIQVFVDELYAPILLSVNPSNFIPPSGMSGFYPREIFLHPRNPELFYVKLPVHVCLMTFIGHQAHVIECSLVLDKIIPEQSWTVVAGIQSFAVFTPEGIKEYAILGNKSTLLHTLSLESKAILPVFYNQFLNTAIFKTDNNKVIYYKLNKPLIDSLYYSTPLSVSGSDTTGGQFSTQGYWTVSQESWSAFRQSPNTKLSIEVVGNTKQFRSDFQFTIKVKGGSQDEIDIDDNITIIKYATKISNVANQTNSVITLPAKGEQKTIDIDPSLYFTGPRANYHIVCPYCDQTIKLQTALKNKQQNKKIIGAASIMSAFDNLALVLTNNKIYLVDNTSEIITETEIDNAKQCTEMTWHENVGLLVFCSSFDGQEMLRFDVTLSSIKQRAQTYPIHEEGMINVADQIFISEIAPGSYWVLVEDNDITQVRQQLTKLANVKVFMLTEASLQFKGILTSKSFGLNVELPLNDLDVVNERVLMATIGNVGIGYGMLSSNEDEINILQNAKVIQFKEIPEMIEYFLEDSILQQVSLVGMSSSKLHILVTSTTSFAMILEFEIQPDSSLKFSKIKEIYNRYGTINSINWHAVTDQILMLAYYNSQTFEEYVVVYQRSQKEIVDFVEAITVKIPQKLLAEHTVSLMSGNVLLLTETASQASANPKLVRYEVSPTYKLLLTYQETGTFSNITLSTSNFYSSSFVEMKVQFENPSDQDSGMKWYTIMIITLIALLIVGIAYGMFLKMMKDRKEKKVSLLTEGQELDEQI